MFKGAAYLKSAHKEPQRELKAPSTRAYVQQVSLIFYLEKLSDSSHVQQGPINKRHGILLQLHIQKTKAV